MNLKDKIINKTWKKCFIIFVVIFFAIVSVAGFSIVYLSDTISENNIYPDIIIIDDKIDNNTSNYLIIDKNNKTYNITKDKYGNKMFRKIEVGQEYEVVLKEPQSQNGIPRIIQIDNDIR